MGDEGQVVVSDDGAVRTLTLANVAKRNALTLAMLDQLREACSVPRSVRVIVLRGDGGTFCSGYSLASIPDAAEIGDDEPLTAAVASLAAVPCAVVAVIEGDAIGAGLDLSLAADFRLCSSDARFGITPARFGLVYPWQGLLRSMSVLGGRVTRRLFLTGDMVSAEEASRLGVVDDVAAVGESVEVLAKSWVDRLLGAAPLSIAGTKRTMRLLEERQMLDRDARAEVLALRREALASTDVAEALEAFAARRQPRFTGN